MKITFVSNYYNHHQKSFCMAMNKMIGNDFAFIETSVMREDRRKLGYGEDQKPQYVLQAYSDEKSKQECLNLIMQSDVLIYANVNDEYTVPFIKTGKLSFRYSERWYKKPLKPKNFLHAVIGTWIHHGRFKKYSVYLLCASAYTSADASITKNYINKAFKWGYFPETKKYSFLELREKKSNDIPHIMWAGRFIDWKHLDDAIKALQKIKKEGYSFIFDIVGTGPLEDELKAQVEELNLADCVYFHGSMKPQQVREWMEKSNIYLLTSDFQEGWGAVLNESMNSGCAVVASHAVGAVPYLLSDNENGLIYRYGDCEMLCQKIKCLLDSNDICEKLGESAYKTITDKWNADVAAERFLKICDSINKNEKYFDVFADGPMSKAEIIKNDWF